MVVLHWRRLSRSGNATQHEGASGGFCLSLLRRSELFGKDAVVHLRKLDRIAAKSFSADIGVFSAMLLQKWQWYHSRNRRDFPVRWSKFLESLYGCCCR